MDYPADAICTQCLHRFDEHIGYSLGWCTHDNLRGEGICQCVGFIQKIVPGHYLPENYYGTRDHDISSGSNGETLDATSGV